MAHQFVRKQLNQASPLVFAVSEDGEERTVFLGEPDRIRFVAPMPGYLGFGGPQVQDLAIVRGRDSLELVLSHALLQGFEEARLYDLPPIPLLGDIKSATFSFLGRDENGDLAGWTSTWADPSVLPESIGLEIEFVDDVYIQWPLLTAAIRIDPAALTGLVTGAEGGNRNYSSAIQDMINRRRNRQGDSE
jgi:general secretion pathway protein J